MTMPNRMQVISDVERGDHYYITPLHRCYFWGEYTPFEYTGGARFAYSTTNQLIGNFKKTMDRKGRPEWSHKTAAISKIALALSELWNWDALRTNNVALVPVAPSKAKTDAMYDDRTVQVLRQLEQRVGFALDIRDILSMDGKLVASHKNTGRASPEDLAACMTVQYQNNAQANPPAAIMLFDDVLTTGAHFVAASSKLTTIFPNVPIVGIFFARTCRPNPFEELPDFDM